MRKKNLIRISAAFVVVLALILACVIAELVVRMMYADVSSTADNSSYFARRWQTEHAIKINSLGFRETEIVTDRNRGVIRLVVIGDSFTYGQGLPEEARMTEQLAHLLAQAGLDAEVLNFGWPGTETIDHLRTLRDEVLPLRPDFILLQWFVNDLEGQEEGTRPVYYPLMPVDSIASLLHRNSGLYYLMNSMWQRFQTASGLVEDYTRYLERRFRDPTGESWKVYAATLREFWSVCEQHGVGVGMVLFPQLAGQLGHEYPLGFILQRIQTMCQVEGIKCVDLSERLAQVSPRSALWVNRLDTHPSGLVNAIAAQEVLSVFENDLQFISSRHQTTDP